MPQDAALRLPLGVVAQWPADTANHLPQDKHKVVDKRTYNNKFTHSLFSSQESAFLLISAKNRDSTKAGTPQIMDFMLFCEFSANYNIIPLLQLCVFLAVARVCVLVPDQKKNGL